MERYERYKPSGVEWLGDLPEHWSVLRGKYIWRENVDISNDGSGDLLSVSQYSGVTLNNNTQRVESLSGYKIVSKNDLVINIMLAWLGGLGLSDYQGLASPAYSIFKPITEICERYYHYLYRTSLYLSEFARNSTGVVPSRWRMYGEDFGRILNIVPPLEEQQSIADFLDKKCSKIDEAISQKQRIIDLLNERRQIIIQNAVTKGLNPNATLKDSGIDWIGQIPAHWEVKKLCYLTSKIGSGITPRGGSAIYVDDGIPLLRSQNIHFDRIDLSDVAYITQSIYYSMSNSKVKNGDVLLNITGGSIGRCFYVTEDLGQANVNQHVCIVRPNELVNSLFLYCLFRAHIGQEQIEIEQTGGNREGLTFAALRKFTFAIPDIIEQEYIVEHLSQMNNKIDATISLKQKEIEHLKEYKTTLIDAAVTGKIKI